MVMRQGIPDKGRVLTQLAAFWFARTREIIPNHLMTADGDAIAARLAGLGVGVTNELRATLSGRAMLCRRTRALPVEAVVLDEPSCTSSPSPKSMLTDWIGVPPSAGVTVTVNTAG